MLSRARNRRRFLDSRKQIAERLHVNETEVREYKLRLAQPGGVKLVNQMREARDLEKIRAVQLRWRAKVAKRKLAQLLLERLCGPCGLKALKVSGGVDAVARKLGMEPERVRQRILEPLVIRLQAIRRRKLQRKGPSLLLQVAQDSPYWCVDAHGRVLQRPLTEKRLAEHEEIILQRRKDFGASQMKGKSAQEIREYATKKYCEFVEANSRERYGIWRTLVEQAQAERLRGALKERSWNQEKVVGVCSATLLPEARAKLRERKILETRHAWAGVGIGYSFSDGSTLSPTAEAVLPPVPIAPALPAASVGSAPSVLIAPADGAGSRPSVPTASGAQRGGMLRLQPTVACSDGTPPSHTVVGSGGFPSVPTAASASGIAASIPMLAAPSVLENTEEATLAVAASTAGLPPVPIAAFAPVLGASACTCSDYIPAKAGESAAVGGLPSGLSSCFLTIGVESPAEQRQADDLLRGLEMDLGYDFSLHEML